MLRVENLTVRYQSAEQDVLNNVSFDVKKGEVVAILGASGCGKTTLLNAIQGTLDKKKAVVSGKINRGKSPKIRTVFQESRLLPWMTVLKNVSFGLGAEGLANIEANKISRKMLKLVKLSSAENLYPDQLSVGMKQRANFARALASQPNILLLDEPFSALDEETKKDIMAEFAAIIKSKKLTTIFVTHNSAESKELASRVITLNQSFMGDSRVQNPEDIFYQDLTVED